MQLPDSKTRTTYTREVKIIETELEDETSDESSKTNLIEVQKRLDALAEKYQYEEDLGTARYKLYELQALVHYFNGDDEKALDFINSATDIRGMSYPRAEKLKKQISKKLSSETTMDKSPVFFHRSPTTVALLSLFTFNLYSIYWSYKHWSSISRSTKESTYPFLAAIFQLFTTYPLFKKIRNSAQHHGYKKFKLAGAAATGYILLSIFLNGRGNVAAKSISEELGGFLGTLALGAGIAAILATIQKAANESNYVVLGKDYKPKTTYPGEIIISTVGILVYVALLFLTISNISNNSYPQGSESEISTQESIMTNLRQKYDSCSSNLESMRNRVDTTSSSEVNSFNNDLADCEDIRLELNTAVDEYDRLAGLKD